MALFTKSILRDREISDGIRISVMSRHTLNDGITPDDRITQDKFDEHLSKLAPYPKLIGDYYKRGLPWKEFEKRYLDQIRTADYSLLVQSLAYRALRQDLTLLCIEATAQNCHRRLLSEECLKYQMNLVVEHR